MGLFNKVLDGKDDKKGGKNEKDSAPKKKTSTIVKKVNMPERSRVERILEGERNRVSTLLITLTLIILLSTVLLVICCIFLGSFKLHLLTMASNNFRGGPILMIIASSCSIGFSILCITLIFEKKRNLYAIFSVLGCIVFCIQLAALILAFILRNNIQTDLNKVNVERQLEMAVSDNSTMETWSSLQTRYSCCGGRGASGYREWEKYLLSSYPDSCCTVPYPDCGIQARRSLDTDFTQKIYERIHVKGCITTIKESWDTYVMPLLLAWGLIGIVVALCELFLILSCVLFSYHLSTSTRRTRTSSTGRMELEPLKYTSTLNVNLTERRN